MVLANIRPDSEFESLLGDANSPARQPPNLLGTGTRRQVYAYPADGDWVIKECRHADYRQNWTEWLMWEQIKDEEPVRGRQHLRSIFAECRAISVTGRYLVMDRLAMLTVADKPDRPDRPLWTTDPKWTSCLGRSHAGAVKYLDYGLVKLGAILAGANSIPWP